MKKAYNSIVGIVKNIKIQTNIKDKIFKNAKTNKNNNNNTIENKKDGNVFMHCDGNKCNNNSNFHPSI